MSFPREWPRRLSTRESAVLCALVGLAAASYAVYGILLNPLRPHVLTPLGYYGQVDQSYYLRSARVLAKLRLPNAPVQYFYGLGYPVLGALFTRIGFRGDPFAPADVLLFGGICSLTFMLTNRLWQLVFGRTSAAAALVAVAVLAFSSPLFQFIVTPENSSVVVFAFLAIMVLLTAPRTITWIRAVGVGLLLGWILAARYGDVVFVALPVVAALAMVRRDERARLAAGTAIGLFVVVAVIGYSQYHAFGSPLTTPYHFHTRLQPGLGNDQSLKNYRLAWVPSHFLGVVVTGRINGRQEPTNPMLLQFPLLLFAPIGAFAVLRRAGRNGAVWLAAIVASTLASLFYFAFIAGGAGDLAYGNLRYWATWYPLWAMLAVAGVYYVLLILRARVRAARDRTEGGVVGRGEDRAIEQISNQARSVIDRAIYGA